MLFTLVLAHMVLGATAPLLARLFKQRAFLVAAVLPAISFGWLVSLAPMILSGQAYVENMPWIPALDVTLNARIGIVQWVLGLIVTGVGALVLFYCRWYFCTGSAATRCLGLLVAFAGAMLGLVTADDLMLMYVHWELTTVFSYLLVGNDFTRRANRSAAITALIVTTFGGLAMLVGILMLGAFSGTMSLAALVANPPTGVAAGVAALLMLVGALSKSALVPFHFWLPGAMAAPTPVSAYLHAAAMVKAGVYLVLVMAPAYAAVPGWRTAVTVLGAATMLVGGWRSLRQVDLKLLLAYGTVSQLGFLVLLAGVGTKAAAVAALAMTLSHTLFKSTLFLTVGVIDHSAGTRDLTKLSGVGRKIPVLAVAATFAAASMAGLPPMLGFIAKESALEALVQLGTAESGLNLTPAFAVLIVAAVVVGSMLTMAYSSRFVWGAFATKPGITTDWHAPEVGMQLSPTVLGTLGLVAGFMGGPLTFVFNQYAATQPTGVPGSGLALWHGFSVPLLLSAIAITGGALLFWRRDDMARLQESFPSVVGAEEWYRRLMYAIDWLGVEITGRTQSGSLSVYLLTIIGVVIAGLGGTILVATTWPQVVWYDNIAQPIIGVVMIIAAIMAAKSRGRIRAVLLVGVTGYGVAMMFLVHGAPDLALTQVLVESVTLIVFLLVFRHMPRYFTTRPLHSSRWWRIGLGILVGLTTGLFALIAAGARVAQPASLPLATSAKEWGYGTNIVNVILVDTRAWDTIGEISVLAIAATGVASLIFLRSRVQNVQRPTFEGTGKTPEGARESNLVWLRGIHNLKPESRSLVFEVTTRVLFGLMLLISVWLLLAGHNWPGGGFAGGLVAGMALVIRYLAAGRDELNEAAPFDAGLLLGIGLMVAVGAAIAPVFFGGVVLQSFDATVSLGILGEVHLVSSTIFDIGVYLVVIGVLLDFVRSLGSGIDIQEAEERAPMPKPDSTVTMSIAKRGDVR